MKLLGEQEAIAPTAPTLDCTCTYGSEEGCDVIFLPGDVEVWRLPAHKIILSENNLVFKAMFNFPGDVSHEDKVPVITVPDVDAKAFDNLLRYLYHEHVTLSTQCTKTLIQTLYAAHKYQCIGLVRDIVEELSSKVSVVNCLAIIKAARLLAGDTENLENHIRELNMGSQVDEGIEDSFSSCNLSLSQIDSEDLNVIEKYCAKLLVDCIYFIDREASEVLRCDEFEELDLETINLILMRDQLDIKDELDVFRALSRWADKECKRQQLPLTTASKRQVLGRSLFLPRYIVMSSKSFESEDGPVNSGLLAPKEIAFFSRLKKITKHDKKKSLLLKYYLFDLLNLPEAGMIDPYFKKQIMERCPSKNVSNRKSCQQLQSKEQGKKKGRLSFRKSFHHLERDGVSLSNVNLGSTSNRSLGCFGCGRGVRSGIVSPPYGSQQSSPTRSLDSQRYKGAMSHKMNQAFDKFILCLACLFD